MKHNTKSLYIGGVKNYPEIDALGKHIRTLRENREMTQMDVAVAISKEPAYISRIENGRINPTLIVLIHLSRAFKISLKDLMDF